MGRMVKKFIFKEKQSDNKVTNLEISDENKGDKKITFTVDGKNPFFIEFESVKDLIKVLQELVDNIPKQVSGVSIRGIAQKEDIKPAPSINEVVKKLPTSDQLMSRFMQDGG